MVKAMSASELAAINPPLVRNVTRGRQVAAQPAFGLAGGGVTAEMILDGSDAQPLGFVLVDPKLAGQGVDGKAAVNRLIGVISKRRQAPLHHLDRGRHFLVHAPRVGSTTDGVLQGAGITPPGDARHQ